MHPRLQPHALKRPATLPSYHPSQALAELPKAVAMGLLPSSLLDTALYRVLLQQLKLGVYDPHDGRCAWPLLAPADDACVASRADAASTLADPCPYSTLLLRHRNPYTIYIYMHHRNPYDQYGEELLDAAAHRQLAREAAEQAVVLLGNSHGLLPLRAAQRVAVVGPSANERFSANDHGPWDQDTDLHPFYLHIYNGIPSAISTPLAAIEARAVGVAYAPGCSRHGNDTSGIGAAVAAARGADVAVVVVGLDATYEDRPHGRSAVTPYSGATACHYGSLGHSVSGLGRSLQILHRPAPSGSRWCPALSPCRRRSTSRLTPSRRRISTPNPNQEEDIDRVHGDDNMWSLPGVQAALLEAVVATGTPTVLVCYLVITPISHRAGVLGLGVDIPPCWCAAAAAVAVHSWWRLQPCMSDAATSRIQAATLCTHAATPWHLRC